STYYFLQDHLGSADTILDGAGNIAETRKFDPFGREFNPLNPTGPISEPSTPVPFGFTGHEQDETGFINMKGRIFDPGVGRFLSPDPIVQPLTSSGLNTYTYVLNNPATLVDPSGFDPDAPGGGDWWPWPPLPSPGDPPPGLGGLSPLPGPEGPPARGGNTWG